MHAKPEFPKMSRDVTGPKVRITHVGQVARDKQVAGRGGEGQLELELIQTQMILPITSAEPALFGVYAVDLLSRWRALRGFRKTLEDDHD